MNISFGWATTSIGAVITSAASIAIETIRTLMTLSFHSRSMGEWPESQLLLRDLPEPGQAVRLDDQEEEDQSAEDHQLDLLLERNRKPEPDRVRRVAQDDRNEHDERGAEEGAQDAAPAADDHHEQDEERDADVERQGLGAAEIEEHQLGPGHPAVERADAEGEQLGAQRPHADDLGGDVAVADRHPGPADATADQVLGDEGEHGDQSQRGEVPRRRCRVRAGDERAEERPVRGGDGARRRIVGEPPDPVEEPDEEELRGEGRDGEVEALDAEARDAEQQPDGGRDDAREHEDDDDVELRERRRQLERRVGADRHEAAGAERELSGVPRQQVEPDGGQRVDQERDQYRLEPVLAGGERRHHEGRDHSGRDEHTVLDDREDRLVTRVRRFELSGLPIDHREAPHGSGDGGVGGRGTRSLHASVGGTAPGWSPAAGGAAHACRVVPRPPTPPSPDPWGVTGVQRRSKAFMASHALDDLLAEEALGPHQQEREGEDVGEPVLDGAADERPPVDLPQLLADTDDEPAHDRARHGLEAAQDQHGQRLERDEREAELHAALGAPHQPGDHRDDTRHRPHDDPDRLERDPDRERRLVVVGDRAERAADAGPLEEHGEHGDQHGGGDRRRQLELVDLDAADDERAVGNSDVELLDVGAPQHLPESLEEEVQADRGHEQDDVFLVDQGSQHRSE